MGPAGELRRRWRLLVPETQASAALGAALLERWAEPHRRYHDQRHLLQVLEAVDLLTEEVGDPTAVRLAAWFHDAVYAGRPDDEDRSATLAMTELPTLGVDGDVVGRVAGLVRMTRHHDPNADDLDGCVLSDADLAVLGSTPDRYRAYVRAVRQEYTHVSDEAFRAGRADVLRALLAQPQLFRTRLGRAQWEAPARRQLHAELAKLTGSTGSTG